MSNLSLEKRLAVLEKQVAKMLTHQTNGTGKKDWRRTVGIFTDNPGMQEIFAEAQRIRERDRDKTRRRRSKKPRLDS